MPLALANMHAKRAGVQENFRRLKSALGFFVINYGLKLVA